MAMRHGQLDDQTAETLRIMLDMERSVKIPESLLGRVLQTLELLLRANTRSIRPDTMAVLITDWKTANPDWWNQIYPDEETPAVDWEAIKKGDTLLWHTDEGEVEVRFLSRPGGKLSERVRVQYLEEPLTSDRFKLAKETDLTVPELVNG
jgi:hypothetical protein